MVCESQPSAAPRSLAAASLLRPAPFDPAHEFAGLTIRAEADGTFHVFTPEGEFAHVNLSAFTPEFTLRNMFYAIRSS
jgi:hypothetical protein